MTGRTNAHTRPCPAVTRAGGPEHDTGRPASQEEVGVHPITSTRNDAGRGRWIPRAQCVSGEACEGVLDNHPTRPHHDQEGIKVV